ncbi:hypothetical protein M3Y98_00887600 [Aphelenchoides besseyi]|nr:hypothetical protein M3Y98_00887600 [Aphelenchoides besseyi]
MDQEGAGVGGFQSTSFAQDCTDKGLTSMISNYARPLQPPDGICCPEECAHGCFFETHQYIEGVGRWRCSKCRPGIDNKPRFWNQYSGKCEYCEHADRLGLVCNKIESEKCKPCFVFGSLTALTTNLLQRKVPMNHTYYINTGNPAVDEKNVNNRRQCRILVGDIEVTQVTRWTQPNLQIQDVDKVESDPKYFTNFKKLGGEFTKVEPVPSSLSFEEKIMNAKKLAATEGLYWHSALFDGSGACSQFCGNNGCKSGASQASWGCVDCNVESFKIEEAGLFSCISECPEGYYATEKKECKRCHPNCVGGCSTSGTVFPGACNKCKVYVAKGDKVNENDTARTILFSVRMQIGGYGKAL